MKSRITICLMLLLLCFSVNVFAASAADKKDESTKAASTVTKDAGEVQKADADTKDTSKEDLAPAEMKLEASSDWAYHYNDNKRYPMVWRYRGVATYIDKSSLIVQKYAPPQYIIAVAVFEAGDAGYGKMRNYHTERFFYNFEKTEMYRDRHYGRNDWVFVSPNGTLEQEGYAAKSVGEALFYLAYNMKFYGAYEWKLIPTQNAEPTGAYKKVFFDNFYSRL